MPLCVFRCSFSLYFLANHRLQTEHWNRLLPCVVLCWWYSAWAMNVAPHVSHLKLRLNFGATIFSDFRLSMSWSMKSSCPLALGIEPKLSTVLGLISIALTSRFCLENAVSWLLDTWWFGFCCVNMWKLLFIDGSGFSSSSLINVSTSSIVVCPESNSKLLVKSTLEKCSS